MPGRRKRARCIGFDPDFICFKPCGRPGRGMETLELGADELEALRLSDFEGLYQEECARHMGISRTTLSRTLASAHRKVADALLHGKRLIIAVTQEAETHAADAQAVPLERPRKVERPSSTVGDAAGCGAGRGQGHGAGRGAGRGQGPGGGRGPGGRG